MKTIKADIYTVVPEHELKERKDVPVLDETWFEEGRAAPHVADRLWELGIQEDTEVGVVLSVVPSGVTVRKPTGAVKYKRADDTWVRKTWKVEDLRVLLVGDRGNLSLEDQDRVMIVKLSELFGYDWREIDYELGEMRSPK